MVLFRFARFITRRKLRRCPASQKTIGITIKFSGRCFCFGGMGDFPMSGYGMGRLRIGGSSIDLSRMRNDCAIPLLDGLMEDSVIKRSLGKLIDVRIQAATVWGTVRFH